MPRSSRRVDVEPRALKEEGREEPRYSAQADERPRIMLDRMLWACGVRSQDEATPARAPSRPRRRPVRDHARDTRQKSRVRRSCRAGSGQVRPAPESSTTIRIFRRSRGPRSPRTPSTTRSPRHHTASARGHAGGARAAASSIARSRRGTAVASTVCHEHAERQDPRNPRHFGQGRREQATSTRGRAIVAGAATRRVAGRVRIGS